MNTNDFIDIAHKLTGADQEIKPAADYAAQVNLGMGFAARQSEKAEAAKTQPEAPKIPSLGAAPLAN